MSNTLNLIGAANRQAFFSRRNALAWAVLVIALLANLGTWLYLQEREQLAAQRQFDLLTSEVSQAISKRMTDHEQILLGGAGLFDASQQVDRGEWRTYIERLKLAQNYPGIQGVGYAHFLPPEEVAEFETAVRREGFPSFRLHPPGPREQYSSTLFLEPLSGRNLAAFGYDMLSEPTRRTAMLLAASSGETRITQRVTLRQETHGKVQAGLLMYVPVYRQGLPLESPEQRLAALRGLVFSPYRMDDLMTGILGSQTAKLDFSIYDGSQARPEALLFSAKTSDGNRHPELSTQLQLNLYGQHWTLNFSSLPAFEANYHNDGALVLLGIGVSLLLFVLASVLTLRREQAEALAHKMTLQIRQNSEALRQSEERQRLVLKGSNDGWWDIDLQAQSLFASARAWEMLGYPPDESPQDLQRWLPTLLPADLAALQQELQRAVASAAESFSSETLMLHRAGHQVPVLLRGVILRDADGQLQRLSGTLLDLSERKRVERMQREFVSTVSHELRTPLTSISGSLGLIQGGALGELPESMRQMLDIAYHNSLRLSHLINDLLDMDKLVAGKMTFKLHSLQLDTQIDESLASNQAYADQHGVQLVREPGPGLKVWADAMRVQQVLANFLSNAIKFSPHGAQVRLSSERHEQRLRVSVSDQGPGISAAFRERMFQKFAQADATDSRQKGGTGLGLAISKELIERMGGRIGFDSIEGQGATFWFELPLLEATSLASDAEEAERPCLLVIEDEADIAQLLQQFLSHAGYRVRLAASLEQARRLLAEQRFAAVTLDLRLPDGNGLQLIRELRNDPSTEQLPVLVISAACDEGRLSLNGSFQAIDWLDKPIDQHSLLARLRQALHGLPEKPRVLHIEDDADLRQVIAEQGRTLADFISASSLAEARQLLSQGSYDLILLDLSLPDGNGLELLEELHQHHCSVPVVVLSAQDLPAEHLDRVEASLAKSRTNAQHFLHLLARLLPTKENRHA